MSAQIPPLRKFLLGRIKQGEGPDEARRAKSWFTVDFVGEGDARTVHTRVSGGDPGYGETAKMLAESALCLAFDDNPHDGRLRHDRPGDGREPDGPPGGGRDQVRDPLRFRSHSPPGLARGLPRRCIGHLSLRIAVLRPRQNEEILMGYGFGAFLLVVGLVLALAVTDRSRAST